MKLNISRWVEEHKDNVVEFGSIVGPYVGTPYVFKLPTAELAKQFAELVRSDDPDGTPAGVTEEWQQYRVQS